jgi:uncharacterized membrane protein
VDGDRASWAPPILARAARAGAVMVGLSPWLLPLARAWLPLGAAGVLLDAAFVTTCHRIPERTLVLAGVAMPVCSRCAGIFAGVAVGALVARPTLTPRAWRWAITAASVGMLADVVTQDAGLHPVWHPLRIATGLLFGYALAAACVSLLKRATAEPAPG